MAVCMVVPDVLFLVLLLRKGGLGGLCKASMGRMYSSEDKLNTEAKSDTSSPSSIGADFASLFCA